MKSLFHKLFVNITITPLREKTQPKHKKIFLPSLSVQAIIIL